MFSQQSLTKNIRTSFARIFAIALLLPFVLISPFAATVAFAQGGTCPVNPAALGGQAFITVKTDQNLDIVNIRSGPNSMLYDKVGYLFPGESAPALGRTTGGDWIQIVCSGVPGGVGWVYSANVELIYSGILPEVETPPVPEIKIPLDSTMAAALEYRPTATRLPTFTPPAPTLPPPVFVNLGGPRTSGWTAPLIGGFAIAGVVGLLFSFLFRR